MANTQLGNGTILTFQGGTGANIVARMTSFAWSGIVRAAVPVPSMDDTAGSIVLFSTHYLAGSADVTLQFDSAKAWATAIVAPSETCSLTFGDSSKWAASGALTDVSLAGGDDEAIIITATLTFSGDITMTP